jgi:polar amino acid transport system substrate-binding protein
MLLLLWMGDAAQALEPSAATLVVGISVDDPPLAFMQAGAIHGLEVDLAHHLAVALGRDLRLKRLPEPRELEALRGGRVDVIFSRQPSQDLEALGLGVSHSLLRLGQMAMVRTADLERFPRLIDLTLTDARVGYERGTLGARWVQARLPHAERVPFGGAEDGLEALRENTIDIFIHDATTAWNLAASPEQTALIGLYRELSDEHLRLVTRIEDDTLRRACDRVIENWHRSGTLEQIILKWIPLQIRAAERLSPPRLLPSP